VLPQTSGATPARNTHAAGATREAAARGTTATDATEGATAARDTRIREMAAAGQSSRDIAAEVGLHYSTVARIVARGDTDATHPRFRLVTATPTN
jgi:DNA-binding NarL/FixJ family response regulator